MTDFETHPAGTADLVKRLRLSGMYLQTAQDAADCIEQFEAALTRANAATAAAYEVVKGVRDSRNHFEQKAASQKSRVTRLRHRQRALISALEAIRSTTSLADAKFQANIAIGGWADENLIFDARALATTDQTAALDKLIAEAEARGKRIGITSERITRLIEWLQDDEDNVFLLPHDDVVKMRAILAASKKGGV